MPSGTVKWFNNAKGFGFILPEDGESDLFAHYSSIEMDGYRTLKAGQVVDFDIEKGDKGLHACHIRAHISDSVDAEAREVADTDVTEAIEETKESPLEEVV